MQTKKARRLPIKVPSHVVNRMTKKVAPAETVPARPIQ